MIILAILTGIMSLVGIIVGLLPTIPATPTAITSGGTWLIDQVKLGVSMLRVIYGTELLAAIILIIIVVMNFQFIYAKIMWAVRKLPLNIH